MIDAALLGPWVRRFLLEYLVTERNLALNTQRSYRDTLCLLIAFVAGHVRKEIDQLAVIDVSADIVRLFLWISRTAVSAAWQPVTSGWLRCIHWLALSDCTAPNTSSGVGNSAPSRRNALPDRA